MLSENETKDIMGNNIIAENLKVLVFSTNIDTPAKADQIRQTLLDSDQIYQVSVDLEDSDNVLRIECHPEISPQQMIKPIQKAGFVGARLI